MLDVLSGLRSTASSFTWHAAAVRRALLTERCRTRHAGGILKVGNRTECALLQLVESLGVSYAEVREACAPRVVRQFPFSSDRKRMSTLVESQGGGDSDEASPAARLHLKGAAELVLDLCVTRVQPDGSVQVPGLTGTRDGCRTNL